MAETENEVVEQQRAMVQGLMDRTGLSLSALAVTAKLSASTMTRWWREKTVLRAETMHKLMAVSPEPRDEGSLDREALVDAITLVQQANGMPIERARISAAAIASIYRRLAAGDDFGSQEGAALAARAAIDAASEMLP